MPMSCQLLIVDSKLFTCWYCLQVDGVIIINAAGIIMMVSPAASRMWGYEKGELEGKNVSVLM